MLCSQQHTQTHTPDPEFSYKTKSALLLKQIFLKCINPLNDYTHPIVHKNVERNYSLGQKVISPSLNTATGRTLLLHVIVRIFTVNAGGIIFLCFFLSFFERLACQTIHTAGPPYYLPIKDKDQIQCSFSLLSVFVCFTAVLMVCIYVCQKERMAHTEQIKKVAKCFSAIIKPFTLHLVCLKGAIW